MSLQKKLHSSSFVFQSVLGYALRRPVNPDNSFDTLTHILKEHRPKRHLLFVPLADTKLVFLGYLILFFIYLFSLFHTS